MSATAIAPARGRGVRLGGSPKPKAARGVRRGVRLR